MDDLLIALSKVSGQLVPIAGAVALIFLCVFLKKLWGLIDSITNTVKGLDPTLRLVDKSIEKVQAPLDTVVKLSHTVDKVHDKTADAFGKAADFAAENVEGIKGMVQEKLQKNEAAQTEEAAPEGEENE